MIAAVFDLDRTLLPDTTAERLFLRHLVRRRLLGVGAGLRTLRFALAVGLADAAMRIKADRPYLSGLHEARLRLEGLRCVRERIAPRLACRGLEVLKQHQRAGHSTLLLSGSLPYVVEPLGSQLEVDEVICSRLESCRHRLTGRLRGMHPYGEAKAMLVREYATRCNVDLSLSYCYADHHTDVPMLRLFGTPVCVNPSDQLRQIAMTSGWRIEAFA